MNDQTTYGHDRRHLTALPVDFVARILVLVSTFLVLTIVSALGVCQTIPWWACLGAIVVLVIPQYLLLRRVDRRLCAWWDRQPRERQRTLRARGGVAGWFCVAGLLVFLVSQFG